MLFAGKVVLITGASSGIGAETAIHLSQKGASLCITGRNAEDLQKVADKCTQPVFIVAGDLTKESDTKNILESTIKHYGKLDVLVNNAGNGTSDSIQDPSLEKLDFAFNINVRSVYHLTMLAVPHLIKTKGNIVNVSSIAGVRAFSIGLLSYSMSKAALDQFTRCTAMELAEKQVRVNSINPGTVGTKFHSRAGLEAEQIKKHYERGNIMHPLGRIGTVEDMASAIAFLASDDASFITGVTLSVDGGRHAVTPR